MKLKMNIYKIKIWEEKAEQNDLKYKTNKYLYDFQQFVTVRSYYDNSSIMIYVNEIENRIMHKFKTGYSLELLTPETKLFGSTKSKITKQKKCENVPHLEVTEIVLVHCNIANNVYQQNSRVLFIFTSNKSFGQLSDISPKNFTF